MLMWKDYFNVETYMDEDCLIIRVVKPDNKYSYCLPLDNTARGLDLIMQEEPGDIRFSGIPEEYLEKVTKDGYTAIYEENRDAFDYLYRAEDLKNLTGKKYAGQRNHIHKFEKNTQTWALEDVSDNNIRDILQFLDEVFTFGEDVTQSAEEERAIVREIVQKPETYGMFGSALRANGKIVGFSLAEIRGNIMFTHIEKADRNYPGAYQMLVNSFARKHAGDEVEYINREDDTGDPGLRTAKLAYHPCELIKKYNVLLKKNA